MPITSPPPTASQRAPRSAPPAGILPPAGRITCPGPQKTPTTCREILVALGVPPASSSTVSVLDSEKTGSSTGEPGGGTPPELAGETPALPFVSRPKRWRGPEAPDL